MRGKQNVLLCQFWFFDGVLGLGRKSYLGPVKITSFSNRDFSQINKHDTFWHVVSTGYF